MHDAPDARGALDALARRTFDLLVIGGGITGCRHRARRGAARARASPSSRRTTSPAARRAARRASSTAACATSSTATCDLVFEASRERRMPAAHRAAPRAAARSSSGRCTSGARVPRWKLARRAHALRRARALPQRRARIGRSTRATCSRRSSPRCARDGLVGGASLLRRRDGRRAAHARHRARRARRGRGGRESRRVVPTCVDDGARRAAPRVERRPHAARHRRSARAVVVNAAGPWSDDDPPPRRAGRPPRAARHARACTSPCRASASATTARSRCSRRSTAAVMFVLPAGGMHDHRHDRHRLPTARPSDVRATSATSRYLLARPTPSSPARSSRRATSSPRGRASGRSSPAQLTGDPDAASREHAIAVDACRACSRSPAASSRRIAQWPRDVMDIVCAPSAPCGHGRAPTHEMPLPGGDDRVIARTSRTRARDDRALGHRRRIWCTRTARAGARSGRWRASTARWPTRLVPRCPTSLRSSSAASTHEMARTLGDLLIRRLHVAFETRDHGVSVATRWRDRVAPNARLERETTSLQSYAARSSELFGYRARARATEAQPALSMTVLAGAAGRGWS